MERRVCVAHGSFSQLFSCSALSLTAHPSPGAVPGLSAKQADKTAARWPQRLDALRLQSSLF